MDMSNMMETIIIPWGIKIALALVIFYVGRMVVSAVVGVAQKFMRNREMDDILISFLSSILRWVLLLFVVVAALSQLGIDTTSLVALLGAAGLAIGLSLQSSLANFASGVMLIIFRPFTKGDFVEVAGTSGSVNSISRIAKFSRAGTSSSSLGSTPSNCCGRPEVGVSLSAPGPSPR